MASIKDLAQAAGVSQMTVYRALHNYPDINPETKKRILELAKKKKYRPNLLAKGLIKGKTETIGLIIPAIDNPFIASLIYVIDHTLAERGYSLLLAISHNDEEQQRRNIYELRSRMVDGLIIIPLHQRFPRKEIRELINETFPTVVMGSISNIPVSYVTADLEQGGFDAVKYLLEMGHRRIAHICLPTESKPDGRLIGYRKALKSFRVKYQEKYVIKCDNTTTAGFKVVERILKCRPRPTAIFVYNDNVAIGVLNGLMRAGIKVPEEMSVIGFDDVEMGNLLAVPLTTVRQFIKEEATEMVNILLGQIKDKALRKKPVQKVFQTELIIRGSTAEPGITQKGG
ncbi:LacI family DNA-binding transcriptional regulator [Candidatus Sumerlaeota bacterium]|nr:LacI family DNA-binding transcriptional regulator [Candidatus Sumerlaeota bacterium]